MYSKKLKFELLERSIILPLYYSPLQVNTDQKCQEYKDGKIR